MSILRRFVARMPATVQQAARKLKASRTFSAGQFRSPEPEFDALGEWIGAGDWAIDVGANIGHYTLRMSGLVGPAGRVLALEPVPSTFEVLTHMASRHGAGNISLLNMAASREFELVGIDIPEGRAGGKNFYQAHVAAGHAAPGGLQVLAIPLDGLGIDHRISLIKIDAEGYDSNVVFGARGLIERDRPTLVIESPSAEARAYLTRLEYRAERRAGSPNTLFLAAG